MRERGTQPAPWPPWPSWLLRPARWSPLRSPLPRLPRPPRSPPPPVSMLVPSVRAWERALSMRPRRTRRLVIPITTFATASCPECRRPLSLALASMAAGRSLTASLSAPSWAARSPITMICGPTSLEAGPGSGMRIRRGPVTAKSGCKRNTRSGMTAVTPSCGPTASRLLVSSRTILAPSSRAKPSCSVRSATTTCRFEAAPTLSLTCTRA